MFSEIPLFPLIIPVDLPFLQGLTYVLIDDRPADLMQTNTGWYARLVVPFKQ